MEKWQELAINALINVSVALIAGAILKLTLDSGEIKSSIVTMGAGFYTLFWLVIIARKIERGRKK